MMIYSEKPYQSIDLRKLFESSRVDNKIQHVIDKR